MAGTFKIGQIFGIEINLHWSWVFILVLVTWTFASGVLADSFPDWTADQRWAVGAVIAIIFFTSLLFHELSHSLVARHYGIGVSSITLFVFGGVSSLKSEPGSPRQEFWIAIVGPLSSLGVGLLLGLLYLVLHPLSTGAVAVVANLAVINCAIGVFNLLPGFPMDGGRVLRSFFWARNRSLLDATRMASRIGEVLAYSMMALGVAAFILVGVITGIWVYLIGNFIRSASAASYEQLFVEKVLKGVAVSTIASHDYTPVSPDETIQGVVEHHAMTGSTRYFPVMAGEELLGLLTLTDIHAVPHADWPTTTAYRAMTPVDKLETVRQSEDLARVLMLMATTGANQIPIMDGRLLEGMVQRADILGYIHVRQELGSGVSTH